MHMSPVYTYIYIYIRIRNQTRQLRASATLNSPKASAFFQLSVSFPCYPFSLTRFGATEQRSRKASMSGIWGFTLPDGVGVDSS